ncbi:hypothetical protein SJPD1_2879 [Sulfurospirillum diekertiae]|uniref:Uncharacterized protein n=1 Tax=Sulfurospirillum diekertiae TaxID=1854492 RepID=A0A290HHP5_9BACT|nr:hypothetical protein [Sulfurospirillum diekertiae]ATB70957.1 hypothetical protein SJPD1_2879 [Sulfurospirillum diekertiae]
MNTNSLIVAKTFTCKYDAKEDRLLLTLNYEIQAERIDFWITRSFLLKLIPIFFDFTQHDNGIVNELIEQTPQKDKPTDSSLYLLTQKTPILLESVDFSKEAQGTKIVFKNSEEAIFCETVLDERMMKSVVKLILNSAPKYEWGIYSIF